MSTSLSLYKATLLKDGLSRTLTLFASAVRYCKPLGMAGTDCKSLVVKVRFKSCVPRVPSPRIGRWAVRKGRPRQDPINTSNNANSVEVHIPSRLYTQPKSSPVASQMKSRHPIHADYTSVPPGRQRLVCLSSYQLSNLLSGPSSAAFQVVASGLLLEVWRWPW